MAFGMIDAPCALLWSSHGAALLKKALVNSTVFAVSPILFLTAIPS